MSYYNNSKLDLNQFLEYSKDFEKVFGIFYCLIEEMIILVETKNGFLTTFRIDLEVVEYYENNFNYDLLNPSLIYNEVVVTDFFLVAFNESNFYVYDQHQEYNRSGKNFRRLYKRMYNGKYTILYEDIFYLHIINLIE